MEYLFLLAGLALFLMIIFFREALQAKKRQRQFVESLYEGFGKPPKKEYAPERFARVGGYYNRHKGAECVDDITWNDLNMDDVFRRMDHTFSATGEEYLYYTLRNTGQEPEELAYFERMTEWFAVHADERVQVQLLMKELGHTGKFSLYDYIDNLDYLGQRSNRRHYIAIGLFVVLLLLMPFQLSVALLGIAALSVWQIVGYFNEKKEIEPYIISFSFVMRLMKICGRLSGFAIPVCARERETIQKNLRQLGSVRRGSWWVFSSGQSKMTGNPLDVIMDYVRMVFHVDLIVFNRMLAGLRGHLEEIDGLITQAGKIETAISVSAFRASLRDGWCVPELCGTAEDGGLGLYLENGYHPLLEDPVKNSINADRGILLTGSNASGKSTFLKTVALNAILAQTIHTCAADSYRAACFRIYSSMALRDDLSSGESYYIVEIKALKRILDACRDSLTSGEKQARAGAGKPVLCFVDEVLRGTNTVERIAASTQIMRSLAGPGILCFAATHDIELTELLRDAYDNYHFEEEVRNGDISFPYKLLQGRATTRNAIKLLEIMGYDASIIDSAGQMAQRFVETKTWQG